MSEARNPSKNAVKAEYAEHIKRVFAEAQHDGLNLEDLREIIEYAENKTQTFNYLNAKLEAEYGGDTVEETYRNMERQMLADGDLDEEDAVWY
ncbi:hypothetical protein ACFO0N_07315 [Halobium salinum]|uniref:Uncharacterized protein n=1 Tax=Halobium salinum TaxID=1364940 RepID=A0ABD5PBC1_9EURY|nr:hypothetical protein [Halobium salinum]